jgi:hypothetical protein
MRGSLRLPSEKSMAKRKRKTNMRSEKSSNRPDVGVSLAACFFGRREERSRSIK